MFFPGIETAPDDPILGLTDAFRKDSRPEKVNLGVGVFVDANGATPVPECVRRAERLLWETEKTKSYMPIAGAAEYGGEVAHLVFGRDFHAHGTGGVAVAQTPGGTGALRVGAELVRHVRPGATVWLPNPTWGNHVGLFASAGLAVRSYPYYNPASRGVDVEDTCAALERVAAGDVVVLHVCCHNPTGADFDAAGWARVAETAAKAGWLPFFDFAYQGFGAGIEEDRAGLLAVLQRVPEALVASSFSKNMGLYAERVGALMLVGEDRKAVAGGFSQIKRIARVLYSNPPKHGAALAQIVLRDEELRGLWVREVEEMRMRIKRIRAELVAGLARRDTGVDFSFVARQNGMFSFSGLEDARVDYLREKKAIYMVKGGRINVAGLMPENIDYVCDSIAESLRI